MLRTNGTPKKHLLSVAAITVTLSLVASAGFFVGNSLARAKANNINIKLLTRQTVLGQEIAYPRDAQPEITGAIVTFRPGGQTGWHEHPVPMFAYILEGELRVRYDQHGEKTYKAGDMLIEAVDVLHNGRNPGSTPAKILVVSFGAVGVPTSIMASPMKKVPAP